MQTQMFEMLQRPFNGPTGGQVAGQVAVQAGGPMGDHMRGQMAGMMHGGHGGFFLGGLFGGLMTAVWAAIIVLLVLWIAKNWSSPKNPIPGLFQRASTAVQTSIGKSATQTPLEILQIRYAKGEITRDEYEMIRRDLGGEAPTVEVPVTQAPPPEAPAQA
ncbi:MAG: SHOCT domain-containing protein [Caldilineaceae bacterium]